VKHGAVHSYVEARRRLSPGPWHGVPTEEDDVNDTLRTLELWARLNDNHRRQLLWLAAEFTDWERRYGYG
jgi:hypothetical protein